MSNPNRVIKVIVINDLVCPYCYIGHKELLIVVSECSDLPVSIEIEYRPFHLTAIPEDAPVNKKEYFLNKFGPEKLAAMRKALLTWAEQIGLSFNLDDGVIASTIRAHRLSIKAYRLGGQDLQLPFLSAVFKAYTSDAEDLGSMDVLGEAAESAGVMKKQEAIEFLKGEELKDEVVKMAEAAKGKGVKGVPVTIIDGKWVLSGGQKAEVFVQIFKKLASATPDASSPLPDDVEETSPCKDTP